MRLQNQIAALTLFSLCSLPACGGDDSSEDASESTSLSEATEGTEATEATDDGTATTTSGDDDSTSGDDDSTSGDGDSTSGDGDSTSGDGDSTSGDGDSTSGDGDSTTGDGDGDCEPITEDASAIGNTCDPDEPNDCPAGYVCGENTGIVLTHNCRIECAEDCECPDGTTCQSMSDKAATWMECRP